MTEQEKFEAWYVKQYRCYPSKNNDTRDHDLLDCWQAAIANCEPMTQQQIAEQFTDFDAPLTFFRGIRLAERFHGIGD